MDKFTMSRKESNQIPIFERLFKGEITQKAAAKALMMSARQVRNKLRRYEKEGAAGLVHKSRGRANLHQWSNEELELAMDLLRGPFKGFGPTFAAEKLEELHGIAVSKETLRKAMIKEGLWRSKKKKQVYRSRRPRKLNFGQMVQGDGSPHDWFEGRAPGCTLLLFVDDATSRYVWAEFAESESMESLMRATRNYIEAYGRPVSIYVDFGSVFSVNTNNPDREKLTQYGRAMKELGIEVKYARSPQAKGRVERANGVLQDRLVKELRLKNISSIEEASKYLREEFLAKHNQKFAVEPEAQQDLHRSIDGFDLDKIFCRKEERVLQNDFIVQYKNRLLQLHREQRTIIRPKDRIVVHEALDGSISLHIRSTELYFNEVSMRPAKPAPKKRVTNPSRLWKPAADHPWRRYSGDKNPHNQRKGLQ